VNLRVGRVYDPPSGEDGRRILVDRLWPRGLSKDHAALDGWCKAVAPSDELRRWYDHDPDRFDEFAARYREEMEDPERAAALEAIVAAAKAGTVSLLTATKELSLSHAPIIAAIVEGSD
jgi:uncharacterized protein YeaO (DUF488 family)